MSKFFAGGLVLLAGFAVFAAPIEPAKFAQVEVIVASAVNARLKLPTLDLVLYRAHRQLPYAEFVCVDPDDRDFVVDTPLIASQCTRGVLGEAHAGRPRS